MANEKRLIDANALTHEIIFVKKCLACEDKAGEWTKGYRSGLEAAISQIYETPTVDAVEVVHGRWVLTAHEEQRNYRWNVTAECSECNHSKGEIYAGFFTGFPEGIAREIVRDCACSVKLDNYCPNCGAKMDGERKDNV